MTALTYVATSAFGLEKLVKNEIMRLGYDITHVENGSITFKGDWEAMARCNIQLRCAERLFLQVGQFEAKSFEALFQGIQGIPWHEYLVEDAECPVQAKSVKSQLYSLSDIQSISKKSIVESLKKTYGISWLSEAGQVVPIHVQIFQDQVTVLLDTSGTGLHKRGYRAQGNEAPLKETLAAALVLLSNWYGDTPLVDPMCGTGTILIEAALLAKKIAPGLRRDFISETWSFVPKEAYKKARTEAEAMIDHQRQLDIRGFDIQAQSIATAKENADLAGVLDQITFEQGDARTIKLKGDYGRVICNPPYGERLEDAKKAFDLYEAVGKNFQSLTNWSTFFLTSHDGFERAYGQKASKNRKLYNGKIRCYYYQNIGPKPPRTERVREEK